MSRPGRLLVTPGMGIGPEVTARALQGQPMAELVLVGRATMMEPEARRAGLSLIRIEDLDEPTGPGQLPLLDPGDAVEPCEVASIRLAARACLEGRAAGMVTGPIHKKKLADQGFRFSGHTDFLEHLCGKSRAVMAFVGGDLRVALVTTHVPLMRVGALLDVEDIGRVVRIAARALQDDLGLEAPRIAVCGLNPHAGEGGLLGQEELRVIGPATEMLRQEGLLVLGPVSAETAFLLARTGEADLVVAMYHDQGLAPLKAVDFGRSVNWTLGLPILRTSVDHGTADALVGTGRADPASMVAALGLAREIARRRRGEAQP